MGDNQNAAEIYKSTLSKMKFDKKKKFYLPIGLALIPIVIATLSLWLQYKTESNKQKTKIVQDTIQLSAPDSQKKTNVIGIKKDSTKKH